MLGGSAQGILSFINNLKSEHSQGSGETTSMAASCTCTSNAPTRPAAHPTTTHRLAAQRAPLFHRLWKPGIRISKRVTKLPAAAAGTSTAHERSADTNKATTPRSESRAGPRGHGTWPGDAQDPFVTVSSSISSSPSSVGPEEKHSQSHIDCERARTLHSVTRHTDAAASARGAAARGPPVSGGCRMGWLLP